MGERHDALQRSDEVKCPLCRGSVSGWIPAGDVRQYLDKKLRNCSHDSCKFVGSYVQLREHARTAHLLTKPAHVDLSRKRTWDRLEREQEIGDVISAIRSQIPGAIIVGDYVIDTRDAMSPNGDIDSGDESNEEWWSSVRDELPDNGGSSSLWLNETLGSSSIWPSDERHGMSRLLPQNNRSSTRFSFSDRHRMSSDWLRARRSSTQSLSQQGLSNRQSRHRSSYRRRTIFHHSNAGIRDLGTSSNLDNPSSVSGRQQRLRYTRRSQH